MLPSNPEEGRRPGSRNNRRALASAPPGLDPSPLILVELPIDRVLFTQDMSSLVSIRVIYQLLRHPPFLAQLHPDIHPRLDPLEADIHDTDELQRREGPPRQRPQDVVSPLSR